MISKRIQAISSFIRPYKKIADVGCDHGYLIIDAFLRHNIEFAQAIDNKEGPLSNAREKIRNYDFYDKVQFSLSDGIENLDVGVEAVVIAGLGGHAIVEILTSNFEKLKNVKRLIIQPNRNQYDVRKWAQEFKWEIINEEILEENGLFYEIIVLERAKEIILYSEKELFFGPFLILKRDEVFLRKWHQEYNYLTSLIDKLDQHNLEKSSLLKKETLLIKEIINESKEYY